MEHLYEKALESAECPRAGNRQSGGRYHVPLAWRRHPEDVKTARIMPDLCAHGASSTSFTPVRSISFDQW